MGATFRQFTAISILFLLFASIPRRGTAGVSSRLELSGGVVFPQDQYGGPYGNGRPAVAMFASLRPDGWPLGMVGYAAGSVHSYLGNTFDYPGFSDFLTADYRDFDGDIGVGLERDFWISSVRTALGGGLMRGTLNRRASLADWARVYTYPTSGSWVTFGVSKAIAGRLDIGGRGLYTWKEISLPYFNEKEKGGGLQLGISLAYRVSGGRR